MKKKSKSEAAPAESPVEARKPKKPSKAKRAKPGDKKPEPKNFDFVGKVESVVVKSGAGTEVFEFGLRGRHGSHQILRLKMSDSFAQNIMAPIVTAAHATESKIGVRVASMEGEIPFVIEVASRPKLGKEV